MGNVRVQPWWVALLTVLLSLGWLTLDYLTVQHEPVLFRPSFDPEKLSSLFSALLFSTALTLALRYLHRRDGSSIPRHRLTRVATFSGLAFFCALVAASSFIHMEHRKEILERQASVLVIAASHGDALSRLLYQAKSATATLAYLIRIRNGRIDDFEVIAKELRTNASGITNLQLAPNGVVRQIEPLAGNEKAIGHDLLADPRRSREAVAAIQSGKLSLAGPFTLIQGGVAVIARQPVYTNGGAQFWGFANALMLLDPLLEQSRIRKLEEQGMTWSLSRTHPDSHTEVAFASSQAPLGVTPISYTLSVPNGNWTLHVSPLGGWVPEDRQFIDFVLVLILVVIVTQLVYTTLCSPLILTEELDHRTHDLNEERMLLNQTQTLARTGSWKRDLKQRTLTWSRETFEILGISGPAPPSTQEILNGVHPDDRSRVRDAWRSVAFGHPYEIEFRYRCGTLYRWIRETAVPQRLLSRHVNNIVGASQDITDLKLIEQKLRDSEERLALALSGSELGTWEIDFSNGKANWNQRWAEMLDYRLDELQPSLDQWQRLVHPDDLPVVMSRLANHLQGSAESYEADFRMRTKGGEWRWIHAKGKVFERDAEGRPIRAAGTHLDITERKALELELKTLSLAIRHSPAATMITTPEPKIIYVNPQFTQATGYTLEEVSGKNPSILQSGNTPHSTYKDLWSTILAKKVWHGELWNRAKDGRLVLENVAIAPVLDDRGVIVNYVAVKQDITEQRQMEQTIWHQANFDQLTGLANRGHFIKLCEKAIQRAECSGERVLILFIDLDRFKPINDTYGHEAGDQVLREFARRLKAAVRSTDTAARMGGDEFTVLMEDLAKEQPVAKITNTLYHTLVDRPYRLARSTDPTPHIEARIGASLGFALYPDHGTTLKMLLSHADRAMYQEKAQHGELEDEETAHGADTPDN